jgi:hypothetical protein
MSNPLYAERLARSCQATADQVEWRRVQSSMTAIILGIVGSVLSVITIFAIYYGPIRALKIQRQLDAEREARGRKLGVFKALMCNRSVRLSPAYVQALNLIDVEFTENTAEERAVRDAWRELNDLYASFNKTPNAADKANDLNAALLAAMGRCLGYDFDKVYLKKGAYYPEFLVNVEVEQHSLRKLVLELLGGTGKRKIPVAIFEQKFPDLADTPNPQQKTGDGSSGN